MDNIFEIKFPIESEIKDKVITKFSNKQGGAYNIFSFYWQCFVWAATIGFLRNERKPLGTGTERIFSLNTMRSNNGEKDAQALICMCIARAGSVDIMKDPSQAIQVISEYANGGFYHIIKLMENGENSFNDLEKVKQEIFARNYWNKERNHDTTENIKTISRGSLNNAFDGIPEYDEERKKQDERDFAEEKNNNMEKAIKRWNRSDIADLKNYFNQGMSIEQLSKFFSCSEDNVKEQLVKLGLLNE